MKTMIKKGLLAVTLMIGFNPLYAGTGHSHAPVEVSTTIIKTVAKEEINRLAKSGKIDNSWLNKDINKIEKYNQGQEWRVIFNNDKIEDAAKQTLYIFVDNVGRLTGSNYTGK